MVQIAEPSLRSRFLTKQQQQQQQQRPQKHYELIFHLFIYSKNSKHKHLKYKKTNSTVIKTKMPLLYLYIEELDILLVLRTTISDKRSSVASETLVTHFKFTIKPETDFSLYEDRRSYRKYLLQVTYPTSVNLCSLCVDKLYVLPFFSIYR